MPITDAMKEGKEPMRTFGDLMQFFDQKTKPPENAQKPAGQSAEAKRIDRKNRPHFSRNARDQPSEPACEDQPMKKQNPSEANEVQDRANDKREVIMLKIPSRSKMPLNLSPDKMHESNRMAAEIL